MPKVTGVIKGKLGKVGNTVANGPKLAPNSKQPKAYQSTNKPKQAVSVANRGLKRVVTKGACIACGGSGTNSRGSTCTPCQGSGKPRPDMAPTVRR